MAGAQALGGGEAMVATGQFAPDGPLAASWAALEAFASLPTQGFAFADALSRTLLAGAPIEVFVAAGAGGIAALVPLCRAPGRFARWRLAGVQEVHEPGDALYRDADAARRLAELVLREGRPLALERLCGDSQFIEALRSAARGRALVSVRPTTPSPTIALDASWTTPEARFNSGRRSDFRRAARRAAEFGTVSFDLLSPDPAEFDALFDEAVAVEAASWKTAAGSALAADHAREAFFRAWFRATAERGELRMAFMRIDGRAVAMQLAIESLGRYWLFKIGYDEGFSRCSPGTLLMLHTLDWAAQRGLSGYEFLGNAEPWIAELWTSEAHGHVRLRTYPFNLRGLVALAEDGAEWLRARLSRRIAALQPAGA